MAYNLDEFAADCRRILKELRRGTLLTRWTKFSLGSSKPSEQ
jgi:hypothetical protein